MPYPNSALSSKSEFAHAGPRPSASQVHGVVGRLPPKMDEQPVALATTMRSPKSCVASFRYGVSPQPAHAPENSNSGRRNCEPLTEPGFTATRSGSGRPRKYSKLIPSDLL